MCVRRPDSDPTLAQDRRAGDRAMWHRAGVPMVPMWRMSAGGVGMRGFRAGTRGEDAAPASFRAPGVAGRTGAARRSLRFDACAPRRVEPARRPHPSWSVDLDYAHSGERPRHGVQFPRAGGTNVTNADDDRPWALVSGQWM